MSPFRYDNRAFERTSRPQGHDIRDIDEAQHHVRPLHNDLPAQPFGAPQKSRHGIRTVQVLLGEKTNPDGRINLEKTVVTVEYPQGDAVSLLGKAIHEPRQAPFGPTAAHGGDHTKDPKGPVCGLFALHQRHGPR